MRVAGQITIRIKIGINFLIRVVIAGLISIYDIMYVAHYQYIARGGWGCIVKPYNRWPSFKKPELARR